MLGARSKVASSLDVLTRRLAVHRISGSFGVHARHRSPAIVGSLRQHDNHHCCWYSNTCMVSKKPSKEEEIIMQVFNEQPELQTINRPDDMTDEDIDEMFQEEIAKYKKQEEDRFVPNWKPGMRKRPLQYTYDEEEFEYALDPTLEPRWTHLDRRCGLLAIKVGMMPLFDDWGVRHTCTILFVDQNTVLGHKTEEKHGYIAVQICAGQRKRKNVSKAVLGQYKDLMNDTEYEDDHPPYLMREFRLSDERWLIPVNTTMHARHFVPGQNVDIAGISKGKGFQGPMKRWGFSGMPASHGVSKSHRAHGSTGSCQDPGRVWKGKKMAGRMGGDRVTVQNLRVMKIDRGRDLIFVRGHVPGNRGGFVEIRDSIKKPLWKTEKVQAKEDGTIPDRPPLPTFEYDQNVDGCGEAGHEELMPPDQKDPLSGED